MPYDAKAHHRSPALIIYLIDISGSMADPLDGRPKIEHVHEVLEKMFTRMIQRSRTGRSPDDISDRYHAALFAYSDQVVDAFGGPQPISQIAQMGLPRFTAEEATNTWGAFCAARDLLARQIQGFGDRPAPLVCHLTDGEFNGADPEPVAREILGLSVLDGPVLIENIYIGPRLTKSAISDAKAWQGIRGEAELQDPYAHKLLRMSSPLPASYAEMLRQEGGYSVEAGRPMLIPGASRELVELAFTMSRSTPTGPAR